MQANKLMKRWLSSLLVFFVFSGVISTTALAQNRNVTVSGTVMDGTVNDVFIGVTVQNLSTTVGTTTDISGHFSLTVPVGSTLRFSFVGYKTQDYKVTGAQSNLRITMEEDAQKLDEVVVVGYGASARKQDLSAAVGVISNTDELSVRPVSSAASMLQGQLPGVTIQSNGGDPTRGVNIVIRGQGSQKGDNVLWVVDGVPGAPITSVNEIESIVVLKDAASAAIYGAQSGAGGVVLVTTKRAKKGEPSLSYDGTFGIRQASNIIRPLNAEEQLKMRTQSYKNAGMTIPDAWNSERNPWITQTRTNWMDEIFRPAFY